MNAPHRIGSNGAASRAPRRPSRNCAARSRRNSAPPADCDRDTQHKRDARAQAGRNRQQLRHRVTRLRPASPRWSRASTRIRQQVPRRIPRGRIEPHGHHSAPRRRAPRATVRQADRRQFCRSSGRPSRCAGSQTGRSPTRAARARDRCGERHSRRRSACCAGSKYGRTEVRAQQPPGGCCASRCVPTSVEITVRNAPNNTVHEREVVVDHLQRVDRIEAAPSVMNTRTRSSGFAIACGAHSNSIATLPWMPCDAHELPTASIR